MPDRRTIFISSTAEDLKAHREAVAKALQQMGHVPEYFEHTWSARSGRIIDECRRDAAKAHAVVVIVAHRYGWVPSREQGGDGEKSITWHEHDAAIAAGKPVFGFLVDERAKWDQRREIDRFDDECQPPDEDAKIAEIGKAIKRLKQFRALLGEKPCGFFSNPDSLATLVCTAVSRWISQGDSEPFRALAEAVPGEREGFLHALRQARVEWRRIRLAGIDPAQTDAEQPVSSTGLDAIYVGLNVREPRPRPARTSGDSEGRPGTRAGLAEKSDPGGAERDRSPWTALEACIQHPRAVLLGGPGSGKTTFARMLGIEFASRILADGEGPIGSPDRPWFDRPLAPLLVTIRDFATQIGDEDVAHRLVAFIERTFTKAGHGDAWPLVRRMIRDGDAIIMLDGLDEIARSERRAQVVEAIEACAAAHPRTRMLVTCRVAAYTVHEPAAGGRSSEGGAIEDWRLDSKAFPTLQLASFDERQQAEFIGSWYRELAAAGRIDRDPVERTEGLRRAVRRRDLQRMAANPLLLTVMAFVHASIGELPDQRVVLYSKAVEALLWRWQRGRAPGRDPKERQGLQALLDEADTSLLLLEKALWALARLVHSGMATSNSGAEVADIPLQMLLERLASLHRDRTAGLTWAVRLVEALKEGTGLLIETRWGVFTFPHRTFQEYLAARDMATAADPVAEAMACRADPNNLWREVILMVAGTKAHLDNDAKRALPLVEALLKEAAAPGSRRRVEDLVLAADTLCEMTAAAVRGIPEGPTQTAEVAGAVQRAMEDASIDIRDRVRLGSALGRLGDPRPGVMRARAEAGGVAVMAPEIAWSTPIEPGSFPMGNSGAEAGWKDESPRFTARILERYAISKYPTTVGQYRMFIDAGGYRDGVRERFWTHSGLAWRRWGKITGPEIYDDVFQTPNHPQVGVSWYEATAYCRWLAELSGLPIRLPTEMEWERAARHTDAREYPWGAGQGTGDPLRRANIERVIGHTSAVGLLAGDCSECGAVDMAGNVREWCQTRGTEDYKGYPGEVRLDDEEKPGARVVRGGSWNNHHQLARCANRNRRNPDDRYNNLGFRVCVCPFSSSEL